MPAGPSTRTPVTPRVHHHHSPSCRCHSAGPLAARRRQQRQRRPARAACALAAWPPRRARPQPGRPPAAEDEAPLSGRPVGLGHFRPFPNGFTGPSLSFSGSKQPLLLENAYLFPSKTIWSPTVYPTCDAEGITMVGHVHALDRVRVVGGAILPMTCRSLPPTCLFARLHASRILWPACSRIVWPACKPAASDVARVGARACARGVCSPARGRGLSTVRRRRRRVYLARAPCVPSPPACPPAALPACLS
jgi:hypothetical protein